MSFDNASTAQVKWCLAFLLSVLRETSGRRGVLFVHITVDTIILPITRVCVAQAKQVLIAVGLWLVNLSNINMYKHIQLMCAHMYIYLHIQTDTESSIIIYKHMYIYIYIHNYIYT